MTHPTYDSLHSRYQCIGDDIRGYFVESRYPSRFNDQMWIVPGTYRDDPEYERSPVMASYARAHRSHYWLGQYPG